MLLIITFVATSYRPAKGMFRMELASFATVITNLLTKRAVHSLIRTISDLKVTESASAPRAGLSSCSVFIHDCPASYIATSFPKEVP